MHSIAPVTTNQCFEHAKRIADNIFQDIRYLIDAAHLSDNYNKEVMNIKHRYNEATDYLVAYEIVSDVCHLMNNFIIEAKIFYGYENPINEKKLKQHTIELVQLKQKIASIV